MVPLADTLLLADELERKRTSLVFNSHRLVPTSPVAKKRRTERPEAVADLAEITSVHRGMGKHTHLVILSHHITC